MADEQTGAAEDTAFHPFTITKQPPLPTTKIVEESAPGGWMLINTADFDAKVHKKYVEKSTAKVD